MKERSFDEMIAYVNRRVSEMDIAQNYKMELLGMVTAIGYKHEKTAQQWIPVEERFPKVGQTVICQCRADILKLLKRDCGGDWYQDAEHVYMNGFVVAWMPLPEPYKEEQE